MDRNLALEFVRVTEAAAIAASEWIGKGDSKAADQAAVDAMRERFNYIDFHGRVVIGEGKKDEAAELFVGEELGSGIGAEIDIAVDPLEATASVANGMPNAISVIATAPRGALMSGPDTYMDKIAVGPKAKGMLDLNASIEDNLKNLALALDKSVSDLKIVVLKRPRHDGLAQEIYKAGARVIYITDGDVAGAIAPSIPDSGIDALMGIGASSEGVLAAVALKILGGEIQIRWKPKNDELANEILDLGLSLKKVYFTDELITSDPCTFTATGICSGPLLKGVNRLSNGKISTHSLVMRSASGTIRRIETEHNTQ